MPQHQREYLVPRRRHAPSLAGWPWDRLQDYREKLQRELKAVKAEQELREANGSKRQRVRT